MRKQFTVLFVLMLTSSVLVATKPTFSDVSTPSVPEFTLKFEAHPYDVPPVYSIDSYTGENVITEEGYHVENKSIVVTIKNQPFNSSFNGTNYYLFYNLRLKGHFGEQWREVYHLWGTLYPDSITSYQTPNSEYTVFSIPADNYPSDGQIDVQVRAYVGHDSQIFVPGGGLSDHGHYEEGIVLDETSDWSSTQTITLSYPSTANNDSSDQIEQQYQTDQIDQQDQLNLPLVGALILIALVTAILLLYIIKRK
jgi:hypothetical protein